VGTVTFAAPASGALRFKSPESRFVRVLEALAVSGASLAPVASEKKPAPPPADPTQGAPDPPPQTQIEARVTFTGALGFAADPFPGIKGLDLFSYGAPDHPGVGISGLALAVSCLLDKDGKQKPGSKKLSLDLTEIVLADDKLAQRNGSLVKGLPLTLKSFLHADEGLDPSKLGALPINVVELTGPGGRVTSKPQFALEFALPMGSLGGLADAHVSLDASLIVGWGPSTFTPDDDGVGVFVRLPFLSAGAFGLNLQGLLKTVFGDANLMRVQLTDTDSVYVVLFNNIALSVLGLRFPPQVITDFILFAGTGAGGATTLGWSLAATQVAKPSSETLELSA
jgi:hypothetical protein